VGSQYSSYLGSLNVLAQEHQSAVPGNPEFSICWQSAGFEGGGGFRMTTHVLLQLLVRTYLNLTIVFAFMLKVRDV
jgi:hypothetical protein